MTTMTSAELAKIIYDNYPDAPDMIDTDDCKDMDTLRAASKSNIGDGLFRFIVEELYETAVMADGTIDAGQAVSAMMAAMEDIEYVMTGIVEAQGEGGEA
jgi:hypothetical protein